MRNSQRGQTAIEYLLLIGAAILFVILAAAVVRTGILSPGSQELANETAGFRNILDWISPSTGAGGACTNSSQCTTGYCNNSYCCYAGTCCHNSSDCPGILTCSASFNCS
ncbi:MAG: hypothetical protein NTY90_00100 [Candidatus Micrarchaeota archaeon]|nr:hypothetical protein [Candidatus Micrarchaeota archaeon]